MKKTVLMSIALSVLVVMTAFANGQQQSTGSSAQKVTIYQIDLATPWYDQLETSLAKSFSEKHPNVKVVPEYFDDANVPTKVRTTLAAGGDLDSFVMQAVYSPWFEENGTVAPIIPSAFGKKTVQEVVDMWLPGVIKALAGYYQGQYYGIPEQLANYAAWINTAQMKDAGLNPATDIPKTWNQFTSVAEKLTVDKNGQRTRNGVSVNPKTGKFEYNVLLALMEQQGLDWGSEKGFLKSLDSPKAVTALATMTGWVTKSKIWDPGLLDDPRAGFANGLTATFLTGGTWYWGNMKSGSVPASDVKPFPYPRYQGGADVGGYAYGYCVFVAKQSKHQKIAWEWANYFTSFPNRYIKYGDTQPRKTLDPALAAKYIPDYQMFQAEQGKAAQFLRSTKLAQVQDEVYAAIGRVIANGMTPEQSMQQFRTDAHKIFGQ